MKIAIVIDSLGSGGAERVTSVLANAWSERGWKISILTFGDGSTPPFYKLNNKVRHIPLGLSTKKISGVKKLFAIKKLVKNLRRGILELNPDIVISMMDLTNILTLTALVGSRIPVIVSERNYPANTFLLEADKPGFIRVSFPLTREMLYRLALRCVVLTEESRKYFSPGLQGKIEVIPNPVILADEAGEEKLDIPKNTILGMGRFAPQKNFGLLIKAFSLIAADFPDWSLCLIGDGPLRSEYENLINELNLSEKVKLPGKTKSPHTALKDSEVFVLSSDWEGFPNALAEAMAYGTAAVSTNCKSGPADLVQHGINGLLVEPGNANELSAAMRQLLDDPELRLKLGIRAKEVLNTFSLEAVLEKWDSCFQTILTENR